MVRRRPGTGWWCVVGCAGIGWWFVSHGLHGDGVAGFVFVFVVRWTVVVCGERIGEWDCADVHGDRDEFGRDGVGVGWIRRSDAVVGGGDVHAAGAGVGG